MFYVRIFFSGFATRHGTPHEVLFSRVWVGVFGGSEYMKVWGKGREVLGVIFLKAPRVEGI